jgi:hypothetical protein
MEILSYKLLNEAPNIDTTRAGKYATTASLNRLGGELAGKTGISTPEMQAIASTLKDTNVDFEETNIAREYRRVGFLFLKNEPNLYVRLAPIVGGRRGGNMPEEFNQVDESFVTIFTDNGNKCNFFPYNLNAPVQVYAESNERLLNYFSLELYTKTIDRRTGLYFTGSSQNPNQQINVKTYFDNYKMPRRIADNLLFYNLTIGSKFDEVNELYKINDASLLGLKNYGFDTLNTDFLIHFGGVGPAIKIKKKDAEKDYVQETKTPQIVFDIPSNAGLKTIFDGLFSGRIQYNYFGQKFSGAIAAISFNRPYYKSTFKTNTGTAIIIYTQAKIQTSSAPIDCFVSYKGRIVGGKITVSRF